MTVTDLRHLLVLLLALALPVSGWAADAADDAGNDDLSLEMSACSTSPGNRPTGMARWK